MIEDFLWHHVSDEEKKVIKRQSKKIMDSFSKRLAEVDKNTEDVSVERGSGMRDEGNGEDCDETFREMFFKNAPHKEGDFILGEKKKW